MKLYISDLDGTLFDGHAGFGPEGRDHLRRLLIDHDAAFTFATARVVPSGLQALGHPPLRLPMIGCGGAVVQHPDGSVIHERLMDPGLVREGVNLFMGQNLGLTVILGPVLGHARRWWTPDNFNFMDSFIASHWGDSTFTPLGGDDPASMPTVGLSCCGPHGSLDGVQAWAESVPTLRFERVADPYQSGVEVGFVQDLRASKGEAVGILCETLGIRVEQATVFGDAENDLSMFEIPARKIAVARAVEPLKRRADLVLDSKDSVLHFIERELNARA